ncbi:hypothetical protein ACH4RG_14240 [Streptomyces sp. NPDC021019]|uniref:hypothetical protein n=1 Tax=Streptomyces sp. NPDC021019 TaxID=3365108 RepID=UPI0037986C43
MSAVKQMLGAAAIAGMLLATVACGSDEADPKPAADPMQAFQECLQQHGVTTPDRGGQRPGGRPSGRPEGMPSGRPEGAPGGRPGGAPSGRPSGMPSMSEKQQEALQACASLRPQRGGGGPGTNGEQNGD